MYRDPGGSCAYRVFAAFGKGYERDLRGVEERLVDLVDEARNDARRISPLVCVQCIVLLCILR